MGMFVGDLKTCRANGAGDETQGASISTTLTGFEGGEKNCQSLPDSHTLRRFVSAVSPQCIYPGSFLFWFRFWF